MIDEEFHLTERDRLRLAMALGLRYVDDRITHGPPYNPKLRKERRLWLRQSLVALALGLVPLSILFVSGIMAR